MKVGYGESLFLVAFDHRSSFSRGLFGASEPLPAGITARIAADPPAGLPPDVDAVLAWTVREGVTNLVRHAGATTATITV